MYDCKKFLKCSTAFSQFNPWVRKIAWRREWLPTPVSLPREFHGQRRLVGYSSRDHKYSETTVIYTQKPTKKRDLMVCSFHKIKIIKKMRANFWR